MSLNQLIKIFLLILVSVSILCACHFAKTTSCKKTMLSFIEPEGFSVKKLFQDTVDKPRLYWTFVYSKSPKTAKVCENTAANRKLKEFDVLCAFQDGKRIFYREFYDAYDPYALNKGFPAQLDAFQAAPPIRFYWYHVLLFSDDQTIVLKKQMLTESDSFEIDYDVGKVDIIAERVMVGKLKEQNKLVETPLSWIETWVNKIKKQKINPPF